MPGLQSFGRAKPLRLAVVGCGGMGRRHLHGLARLEKAGINPFALTAVCDPRAEPAAAAAQLADELLGRRPAEYSDLSQMATEIAPDAIDVVTTPSTHHAVASQALQLGIHVMVEKPVAITINAANALEAVAAGSGCVLSVAENYRRDPLNRLLRAVIDSRVLGDPALMMDTSLSGGGNVLITPWRSTRAEGGLLLDVGVHHADMFTYFLGPVTEVTAWSGVLEPKRRFAGLNSNLARHYELSNRGVGGEFAADGVDAGFALLRFASGAGGQWSTALGVGGGPPIRMRRVYLEGGMIECPEDRSGRPPTVTLRSERREMIGNEILELVPDFALSGPAAHLFGGDRIGQLDMEFNEIDACITASEYWELGDCILSGSRPEVGVGEGRAAVAVVLGVIESGLAKRSVKIADLLEGRESAYQDRHLAESTGSG
jgi:predicted dehydrogenase